MSGVETEIVSLTEGAGDRALWRAVIAQAMDDATMFCSAEATTSKERLRAAEKTAAVEWLTVPNANFSKVCALAELEPTQVRKRAKACLVKAQNEYKAREARHQRAVARSMAGAVARRERKQPGVGVNFAKTTNDRTTPVAQDCA